MVDLLIDDGDEPQDSVSVGQVQQSFAVLLFSNNDLDLW